MYGWALPLFAIAAGFVSFASPCSIPLVPGYLSYVSAIPTADLADGPMTVMCGHGERAMTAASLLAHRGRHDVIVLDGGPDTWANATGLPLVTGP